MAKVKKSGLGRGLGSLIPKKDNFFSSEETKDKKAKEKKGLFFVPWEKIKANPYQPRTSFDKEKLADLVRSIKEYGILQPLVVNPLEDGSFELIAGERRWRAAQEAGLKEVPVILRESTDKEKLFLALIENVQRADLNALEQARALRQMAEEFGLSHEEIGRQIGKSRVFVSNTIRLLKLPDFLQKALEKGEITSTQARTLISLPLAEQKKFYAKLKKGGVSVRDLEKEAQRTAVRQHWRQFKVKKDPYILGQEEKLKEYFGTKAIIQEVKGKGKIILEFYSPEELAEILKKIFKA